MSFEKKKKKKRDKYTILSTPRGCGEKKGNTARDTNI